MTMHLYRVEYSYKIEGDPYRRNNTTFVVCSDLLRAAELVVDRRAREFHIDRKGEQKVCSDVKVWSVHHIGRADIIDDRRSNDDE